MIHKPIKLNNVSLSFDNNVIFSNITTQINSNKKILIIGNNGSGKSSLLKIITEKLKIFSGNITIPKEVVIGYVPQTILNQKNLSGGQTFNKALSQALALQPNILCLDEPTNHLNEKNKQSLIKMLQHYNNTLLLISHDPSILTLPFDEIWHLENKRLSIFHGNYNEYKSEYEAKVNHLTNQKELLQKQKTKIKKQLQQEQKRLSQSRKANKHEHDKNLLGAMKHRGSYTTGKISKNLSKLSQKNHQKLAKIFIHKEIKPNFIISSKQTTAHRNIIEINNGSCGYKNTILENINLQIKGTEHIAITGNNASGKSTFLKSLLKNQSIWTKGKWYKPDPSEIGYLDQFYSNLSLNQKVIEAIQDKAKNLTDIEIRKHLNDFLFSTPEKVNKKVGQLSGGEKVRLSLAQIAVNTPKILLLDEVTNNVDLQTKNHIKIVLKKYPGAMIIVSHDLEFLYDLDINTKYTVANKTLKLID